VNHTKKFAHLAQKSAITEKDCIESAGREARKVLFRKGNRHFRAQKSAIFRTYIGGASGAWSLRGSLEKKEITMNVPFGSLLF